MRGGSGIFHSTVCSYKLASAVPVAVFMNKSVQIPTEEKSHLSASDCNEASVSLVWEVSMIGGFAIWSSANYKNAVW